MENFRSVFSLPKIITLLTTLALLGCEADVENIPKTNQKSAPNLSANPSQISNIGIKKNLEAKKLQPLTEQEESELLNYIYRQEPGTEARSQDCAYIVSKVLYWMKLVTKFGSEDTVEKGATDLYYQVMALGFKKVDSLDQVERAALIVNHNYEGQYPNIQTVYHVYVVYKVILKNGQISYRYIENGTNRTAGDGEIKHGDATSRIDRGDLIIDINGRQRY